MRKLVVGAVIVAGAGALAGCHGGAKGVMGHAGGPDEFAVARRAPLVVPPDFQLVPPRPGAPRPQEADSSTQALQALFGGSAPRSDSETALISSAGGAPDAGVRSTAADPQTTTVNKGSATRDILTAPTSTSPDASATAGK